MLIILFIVLIIASVLAASWMILLTKIDMQDWVAAAYNKVLDNIATMEKLRKKDTVKQKKLSEFTGIASSVMKILYRGDSQKKIAKLACKNDALQAGEITGVSVIDMPGYVLLRKFDFIGRGSINKTVLERILELYGRKHAENRTKQLMARMLSYSIIGVALTLTLGALFIGIEAVVIGVGILGIGPVLVLVLAYSMYDGLRIKANNRRDAIARQFPNMVSKLTLLITSGMIVDRAWKETAYSQNTELYIEMQKTSEELDNLVSFESAYGNFLKRCNTKETAKLASAIMQNQSKGNAEIGRLLKEMAKEAWQERRHLAKRDSEKANAKLIIPTMIMFAAILLIIMVPIAMNFMGTF